ncbi:MAG: M15 family metallopeptidase [Gammaproteobacteria bacterium]
MQIPEPRQLLGLDAGHVAALPPAACIGDVSLHPEAGSAFLELRAHAAQDGIDLRAVSGYRSFARQLLIWNGKARGERTVLDASEQSVDVRTLSQSELLATILRWSALPGTSRHHWGSDLDVVDAAVLAPGQQPVLERRWFAPGEPFERLGEWLGAALGREDGQEFFRPYRADGEGVAEEPWHLSFAPLASRCEALFDPQLLRTVLAAAELELGGLVDGCLDGLLVRYARVDPACYPDRWRPSSRRRFA